jgi:hypothetical protein
MGEDITGTQSQVSLLRGDTGDNDDGSCDTDSEGWTSYEGECSSSLQDMQLQEGDEATTRNLRSVWYFPTQSYKGAHFATFPQQLPYNCLKASISEQGCCPTCGSQWARVVEKPMPPSKDTRTPGEHTPTGNGKLSGAKLQEWIDQNPAQTIGFLPTCTCPPQEPVPAVVLDIFCGSGTTGIVARELGAHFIGLDLSYPYLHDQARDRLGLTALDAWAQGKGKQDGKVISDLPLFEVKA